MNSFWRGLLAAEPFWLSQREISELTAREIHEWYYRPAMERQKRMERDRDGGIQEENIPTKPEDIEASKMIAKMMLPSRHVPRDEFEKMIGGFPEG